MPPGRGRGPSRSPRARLRLGRQPAAGVRRRRQRMRGHGQELAEPAGVRQLDGEGEPRKAAPLRARLKNPTCSPDHIAKSERVGNGLGAGLLAVDILARPHRQRCRQPMPIRAGRHEHRLDVLPSEKLAQVDVSGAVLVAVFRIDGPLGIRSMRSLHIAHRHALHDRLGQEAAQHVAAPAADADGAEGDSFAGDNGAIESQRPTRHDHRSGHHGTGGRHTPQKLPSARTQLRLVHVFSSYRLSLTATALPM